jgi:hypothetical protein
MKKHELYLPWRVVQNWHGKIAIVDNRNNGEDVVSGRVCNLPQGKNERGLFVADEICRIMNKSGAAQ